MIDTNDAVEKTCTGALWRGAWEDGVLECLRFQAAAGAEGIGLCCPPGRVSCQVAFPGSY